MDNLKSNIYYHSITSEAAVSALRVDTGKGLGEAEASERLTQFGTNSIQEKEKGNPLVILLNQFKSPIVYLLLVAGGLSFYLQELLDVYAILVVIILNAAIGFYMEYQATRSMEALKKLTTIPAKVLRNGQLSEYDSKNIVPGDIIYAEAGDMIAADARIFNETQLQVDESALTGESVPVEKRNVVLTKETILAERINSLYKGTHVTKGNAWAVVTATGMDTELGKIANLVQSAEQSVTPLERKLQVFSKKLIKITVALVILIFIAGLLNGQHLVEMLETSIALAVAAIPEGLPIVATLALAQGMLKMARQNVIVKKLSSVETLGGTNVICTDKTGTLTENRIIVSQVLTNDTIWKEDSNPVNSLSFEIMKRIAILCNTAEIRHNGEGMKEIGDPLETGLLKFAERVGENIEVTRQDFGKMKEEPFSSETKIMATLHHSAGKNMVYSKGAVEELLSRSTHAIKEEMVVPLDEKQRVEWLNAANNMASLGLRIIGGAYKENNPEKENELSSDLTFVGLFGMVDPPRKEVFAALDECHTAGIKVVMITGDHPATAKNIGMQLGIAPKESEVIMGKQIKEYESLSETDKQHLLSATIFARVSPRQKLDLVKVFQERGNVVGMTGDGVNDAPALKKADIGIAMGKRGTQVAQEIADMIIKDDSFSSIVIAIKQGRIIFENIRKFVIFLLSCNLSELFVVAAASVFNLHFQLFPLQILFINIITDVLPALALGVTEGNDAIMKDRPKNIEEPIIDTKRWWTIIFYSTVLSITSIGAVLFSHETVHQMETWNKELCNNVLFFSLIFSQLLHVFNMGKTGTNFFKSEVFRNSYVWASLIVSVIILIIVYLIVPVRNALSVYPLSVEDWIISIGSGFAALLIMQLAKTFKIVKQ